MKQAALYDGFAFDPFPFQHDDVAAAEVDVGGCEVAEALMVAAMVVMIDERRDLLLESKRQADPVFRGLMKAVKLS